ncbi:MAG: phosphoribosylamine--glycine ligase [Saprospiraceae bacterium]|jgi:phosphoribosylamine--glycine ligase|nr:phosphoribosylamine--glycine ligase [Saprospiraceae bacterium]
MSNPKIILLLGGGGREHTFAWKLSLDPGCTQLFIAPGNAGTAECGVNVPISATDFPAIRAFVLENNVGTVIVGPEEPLVRGIVDYFLNDPDLRDIGVIGPSAAGAQLEGSKAFAKKFMERHGIPTARYREVTTVEDGEDFLKTLSPPFVLKADGLAAGKGVLILDNRAEALDALRTMLAGQFGEASRRVVIEEFLSGIEFSVFVLTDGKTFKILPEAKDYKRVGEGDTGPNTGGMGAVSPVPFVTPELWEKVETRIIRPTVQGLSAENMDYKGFVFFGLINVGGNPFVIEYNCRMGDPETEAVLPRLKNNLSDLFRDLLGGQLNRTQIEIIPETAATIMLTAGGYPGDYRKGDPIQIQDKEEDSLYLHAGTTIRDGQLVTNGGRVLAITSFGNSPADAVAKSLQAVERVHFEGKYFRRDIGRDL